MEGDEGNYQLHVLVHQDKIQEDFLKSVPSKRNANRYKSQWSRARQAAQHLNIKWNVTENSEVDLVVREDIITDRRTLFQNIRKHLRGKRTVSLKEIHKHQRQK